MLPPNSITSRLNVALHILKWLLIVRRSCQGHTDTEINNPHVPRAPRDVDGIDPWLDHIAIGPPVRIDRGAQHLLRLRFSQIERASFLRANERNPQVL